MLCFLYEVQMVQLGGSGGCGGDDQRRKKLLQSLKFAKGVYFNREAMRFGERSDADGGRRLNGGVINQRGGMAWRGLRHIFAAAWVRVRAACGDQ